MTMKDLTLNCLSVSLLLVGFCVCGVAENHNADSDQGRWARVRSSCTFDDWSLLSAAQFKGELHDTADPIR
jgi:hypothetical protein